MDHTMSRLQTAPSNPNPLRTAQGRSSIAFVSTYPPAMCGLATFTDSLRSALAKTRGDSRGLEVLELIDQPDETSPRSEVIASIDPADSLSLLKSADRLSGYDAVILQHEYGIWGPDMGRSVVDFVGRLKPRIITALHTLLANPTEVQRQIIEALAERSAFTIVPTQASKDLIVARYRVDPGSILVVPHGTSPFLRSVARLRALGLHPRKPPSLLTWGLIGPGKGLEWSLRAVAQLKENYPEVAYTIAGRTHPKVLRHEGEAYRQSLEAIVTELDLDDNVEFIDEYVSEPMLRDLLLDASIVVLPYDSTEQIVSGVMVEAVAAGVPVVATTFPHSVELAEQGAVSAVAHRSPQDIAQSIALLIEETHVWEEMMAAQSRIAPGLEWTNVALEYEGLIESFAMPSASMRHASPAS